MKTLYIECNMGAAGDMLAGALLEIYGNREKFLETMNNAGIDGVEITAENDVKCGITGTKVHVYVHGEEENTHHEHHHGHHHSSYQGILHTIESYNLPDKVKSDAKEIYSLIGRAESAVHGCDIENIHFHEVGTLDAVADVLGCCLLMYLINPGKVIVSPINTGSGTVRCAHGVLPVPAPAVSRILSGVPIYSGNIESELCTPTGAAILKYYADEFSKMPVMRCEKTGYGMGTKDFDTANCVRAFFGETADEGDSILSVQCNIDDMTGESLGYAADKLRENGALDVFTVPLYMKKNRPGVLLVCLCRVRDKDKFIRLILEETTTRGVRFCEMKRCVMSADFFEVETEYGNIKVKRNYGCGTEKVKPEYESVSEAAKKHGVSFERVYSSVLKKL